MWPHLGRRRAQRLTHAAQQSFAEGEVQLAEERFTLALRKVRRTAGKDPRAAAIAALADIGIGRICLGRDEASAADEWFRAAQGVAPDDPDGYYWAGCAAAHRAEYAAAAEQFDAALVRDAGLGSAYAQRAYVRLRLDRPQFALADLYAAEQVAALDQRGRLIAASLLLQQGSAAQAEAFAGAVPAAERTPQTAAVLALALQQQGKAEPAYDAFTHALSGGLSDDSLLFQHGMAAYQLGRYQASIASWTVLRERHPDRPRFATLVANAHQALARELVAQERFAEAIEELRAAPAPEPEPDAAPGPGSHFAAGSAGSGSGPVPDGAARPGRPDAGPDAPRPDGSSGGSLDSAVAELHLHAAAWALARGDLGSVTRGRLVASRRLRPRDPRPTHYLAVMEAVRGRPDRAAALWRRHLAAVDSADERARLGLALCAAGGDDPESAVEDLRDLAKTATGPGVAVRAARALGALHLRRGDWPAALDALAPFAASDDEWAGPYAEALYRTERFAELLDLPDAGGRRAWQELARRRAWREPARRRAEPPDGAEPPNGGAPEGPEPEGPGLEGPGLRAAAADERTRAELSRLLRDTGLGYAERADWERASAWLLLADTVMAEAPGAAREPLPIDALAHVLGGRRALALRQLERACRLDPTDHRLGFLRALALLHTLSADAAPRAEGADWAACVGAWMAVLHDDAFWAGWRRRAEARYGEPVSAAMLDALHTGVRELIEQRIAADRAAAAGDTALLLRREHEAAKALKAAGGLPLSRARAGRRGARLVCGPLRIAQLGLSREFGSFALALADEPGGAVDVFRRFSRLGLAEVQLNADRPREALSLALDLRCQDCRGRAGLREEAGDGPLTCRPDCRVFDDDNPALSALPDKRGELAAGGRVLAVDALLGLATAAVSARDLDAREVGMSWRQAVRYADRTGLAQVVRRAVADTALGRADALSRKKNWDDSIAVLDEAAGAIGTADRVQRDRVIAQLSQLLAIRGIETVNADDKQVERARGDLQRAADLNPHSVTARSNLGVVLRLTAHQRIGKRPLTEVFALMRAAVEEFQQALVERPGDARLVSYLEAAQADLNVLFTALRRGSDGGRG